jgi:hypothetical protein
MVSSCRNKFFCQARAKYYLFSCWSRVQLYTYILFLNSVSLKAVEENNCTQIFRFILVPLPNTLNEIYCVLRICEIKFYIWWEYADAIWCILKICRICNVFKLNAGTMHGRILCEMKMYVLYTENIQSGQIFYLYWEYSEWI